MNARLEELALTTARAMAEVSRHWDAVYDASAAGRESTTRSPSERDDDAARGAPRRVIGLESPQGATSIAGVSGLLLVGIREVDQER